MFICYLYAVVVFTLLLLTVFYSSVMFFFVLSLSLSLIFRSLFNFVHDMEIVFSLARVYINFRLGVIIFLSHAFDFALFCAWLSLLRANPQFHFFLS